MIMERSSVPSPISLGGAVRPHCWGGDSFVSICHSLTDEAVSCQFMYIVLISENGTVLSNAVSYHEKKRATLQF